MMPDLSEYLKRLGLIGGVACARCGDHRIRAPLSDGTWLCARHLEEAGFGVITVPPYPGPDPEFTDADVATAASLGIAL